MATRHFTALRRLSVGLPQAGLEREAQHGFWDMDAVSPFLRDEWENEVLPSLRYAPPRPSSPPSPALATHACPPPLASTSALRLARLRGRLLACRRQRPTLTHCCLSTQMAPAGG